MNNGARDVRELTGVIPPMITPFADDDSIDREKLKAETEYLLQAGAAGLVVGGSTGEGAGMSEQELYAAVATVMETVDGRVPVLGGVIADTSEEAVRLGLAAKRAGAAALQVPPPHFHFVVTPEVLASYYRAITDATGLPLIIYNVIPWAQVAIQSMDRLLTGNPAIMGVKQSGGNMHALADLLAYLRGRLRIYSAIDDLVYPSLALGADGTISGTSSVFPYETVEMYRAVRAGEFARALELHNRLVPVWRSLDGPHFPSRVKYAMALMGRPTGRPRSPFTWPSGDDARRIEEALAHGGFLAPAGSRAGTESRARMLQ
jgi:4-hydroxy-tetrahydrodipicolinate synthase